jgi:hypothetical protein
MRGVLSKWLRLPENLKTETMKKVHFSNYLILISVMILILSCKNESNIINDEKIDFRSQFHFSKVIGEIIDGNPVITADTNELKTKWSNFLLNSSDLTLIFDKISIVTINNSLYLYAKDFGSGTSAIPLYVEDNHIYEAIKEGGGETYTCSGCTSTGPEAAGECELKGNDKGMYCTDCSEGKCIKTHSLDVGFMKGVLGDY